MGQGQSAVGGGYRVLQVLNGSPCTDVVVFPTPETALEGVRAPTRGTLVTFFDIILSVNGIALDHEGDEFSNEIRANVGRPVLLSVYNTKAQKERPVQVIPRADWGGDGLLGLHVKYDPLETPQDSALHVVDVAPESPAALAGLLPDVDYVMGCPLGTFENADMFGDFLAENDGGVITLFVLRASTDTIRAVSLEVSKQPWGSGRQTGVGLTLAQGHLHMMPNAGSFGLNDFEEVLAVQPAPEPGVSSVQHAVASQLSAGSEPTAPLVLDAVASTVSSNATSPPRNTVDPAVRDVSAADSSLQQQQQLLLQQSEQQPAAAARPTAHWSNGPTANPYPPTASIAETFAAGPPTHGGSETTVPTQAVAPSTAAATLPAPAVSLPPTSRTSHHLLHPSSTLHGSTSASNSTDVPAPPKSGWFR